jgi:hypothetical protein
MKKLMAFLVVTLFLGGMFAAAGPIDGKKFEFGTAVSFMLVSEEGESTGYLNVPVRFGWFVWKGLEIEPEFMVTFPIGEDAGDTGYQLLGHLTYNFQTSGKIVPFIGGGVGFGNSIPIFGVAVGVSGLNTFLVDGLAGIKFFVSDFAALRVEYRLSRFSLKYEDFPSEKETVHQAFVGLSIFF